MEQSKEEKVDGTTRVSSQTDPSKAIALSPALTLVEGRADGLIHDDRPTAPSSPNSPFLHAFRS